MATAAVSGEKSLLFGTTATVPAPTLTEVLSIPGMRFRAFSILIAQLGQSIPSTLKRTGGKAGALLEADINFPLETDEKQAQDRSYSY